MSAVVSDFVYTWLTGHWEPEVDDHVARWPGDEMTTGHGASKRPATRCINTEFSTGYRLDLLEEIQLLIYLMTDGKDLDLIIFDVAGPTNI